MSHEEASNTPGRWDDLDSRGSSVKFHEVPPQSYDWDVCQVMSVNNPSAWPHVYCLRVSFLEQFVGGQMAEKDTVLKYLMSGFSYDFRTNRYEILEIGFIYNAVNKM